MSIEAMKQALEKATEVMEAACIRVDELKAENESLRQAIAEAEKQEPDDLTIAYMSGFHDGKKKREWVGLTDEELKPFCDENYIAYGAYTVDFIKAIEAKLKEKNT
jgi:hypothetical protein